VSAEHPLNERPGGSPYRGADLSTDEPEPTHDEMMDEMRAKVEHERYPGPAHWLAGIMWMTREGARTYLIASGKEATDAVRNLYRHFKRMEGEGWKRTK
jgi:hypothetical protein